MIFEMQMRFSRSSFVFALVLGMLCALALPAHARADDDTPTPPPPSAATTNAPPATPVASSTDVPAAEAPAEASGVEVNVVPADSAASADSIAGSIPPARRLPIWCPEGVEPVPGQNGCTAQFGSLSLLIDYLNANNLADQGKIWIPDPEAQAAQSDVGSDSSMASSSDAPVDNFAGGIDIVILNDNGESLPLNSSDGADALLNGQPVWCPDGTTPATDNGACTNSAGSLGLLVSMIENGSLENGAIYVQQPAHDQANADEGSAPAVAASDTGSSPVDETAAIATNESTDASAAAVINDPIWCPTGSAPDPGVGGCTSAQANLLALVTFLGGVDPTQDGTIWIQQGSDSSASFILINGASYTNWKNQKLTLQGGWSGIAGNSGVSGTSTFAQTISIVGWLNDVSVNDITLDNTGGTGLTVITTSNIAANNLSSNNNAGGASNGASLTSSGATTTVTLTGTNSFSGNGRTGLVISANGDISVNNVTASGNARTGASITNNGAGTGDIQIAGTNDFSNNGTVGVGSGLTLGSNASISANNVTANNNQNRGVFAQTDSASVTFAGTNGFSGNNSNGVWINITNGGSVDVSNVTASGNGAEGALITVASGAGSGAVNVTGTNMFTGNSSNGLTASTYGDITLNNVNASSNTGSANGAVFGTGGNIVINCGTFNSNAAYGFDDGYALPTSPASIALNGVTFSGNASGAFLVNSGGTVLTQNPSYPCSVAGGGKASIKSVLGASSVLPLNIVGVADSAATPVVLDCGNFAGTMLQLSNGDRVVYLCPTSGEASLVHLNAEALPGPIPQNFAFTSSMQTSLTQNGVEQTRTDGELVISFIIPVDLAGFDFTMLYWDGTTWQDLSTAVFTDGRQVFNGGVKTEDGRFEATTNFTGTFVLVRK